MSKYNLIRSVDPVASFEVCVCVCVCGVKVTSCVRKVARALLHTRAAVGESNTDGGMDGRMNTLTQSVLFLYI